MLKLSKLEWGCRALPTNCITIVVSLLFVVAPAQLVGETGSEALTEEQMIDILEELDRRQRAASDYKALVYIEQNEKGEETLLYEALVYRRDRDDQLVILFTKPKTEQGKGYLRIEKNLFLYDPNTGKWERRTERERIGGTGSRRRDFDESRLAEEFTPSFVGRERLGAYTVFHLRLRAKEGADVAYPVMEIWVNVETKNMLKLQEFALSGKLVRTSYYPEWDIIQNDQTGERVHFPRQIRIYDELKKGNNTILLFRAVQLQKLPDNIFTKAWLESKSR
jgi:hypothetical protein